MGEPYGDCELAQRLNVGTKWERVQEYCEGRGIDEQCLT